MFIIPINLSDIISLVLTEKGTNFYDSGLNYVGEFKNNSCKKQTALLFVITVWTTFFEYILLIMLLHLSHFYLLYSPLTCSLLSHLHSQPPYFMSMGVTYKFFGFYISYNILNLPLFCTYQLCCFFPIPFPPFLLSSSPLKTLHVISISLILFLF